MNKRYFGLVGILGSLLLFIGDMFLYGYFGGARGFNDTIQIVAQNESQVRLFIGGLLGPIGAMLYIAGFWHVYLNTKGHSRSVSLIVFISLTCMMMFGGAYHAIWTVRMLLFKFPSASVDASNLFIASFNRYFNALFIISASIGYIGGIFLLFLVLFHKSSYPRWTAVVNPGILLPLAPLAKQAPSPFGSILYGGYINIVFFIFFSFSVMATWKEKKIG
jgi:hypothetical protein